jgi:hypothetical protein
MLMFVLPLTGGTFTAAQAQERISVEFRTALEPHGRWHSHRRWGDVWAPARIADDWRPYKLGRWSYTRDWGWYWASDEDFGWVVYHYGRWVRDPDLGWVWVPGREWGPAYVQWRRGGDHVGWAPLPPEEIIVEYRDEPDVWLFVRSRDILAPRIAAVVLPERRFDVFVRETVFVNRTVIISDRGPSIAVNPGIEPAIVASFVGRPVRTYNVQPRVLAGTRGIEGAVTVSAEDIRARRGERSAMRETRFLKQTQDVIRPAERVPEPQPLAAKEKGRLGDTPPRAARAEADRDRTTGATPAQSNREAEQSKDAARDDGGRPKRDSRRDRDDARRPQTESRGGDDASPERDRPGRDARERVKEERRDAREELKDERRDAREEQQRKRRDARERETEEQSERKRSGAREQAREKREQARERREQAQEKREEQTREKRDARDDVRQKLQRDRQDARDRGRERPAATEGRSPPQEGQRLERGPRPDRDGPRATPRGPRPDVGRSAPSDRAAPPRVEAPRGPSGPAATTGAAPRDAGPPARAPAAGGRGGGPAGRPGGAAGG